MTSAYVSPIPAVDAPDYHDRTGGVAPERRIHLFRQANGTIIPCRPRYCRECYREEYRHV